MLILCCGPDTYRATQRAKELEDAFRAKHDPRGSSIERLPNGKRVVDEVIERSLAVSLFSPMRFVRADGLIEQCAKQKIKPLAHALGKDPERVIVVSIEQEKPTAAVLKSLSEIPKLLVSDYPLLQGREFAQWVHQIGSAHGVTDRAALDALAKACDGDAWLASNELTKIAAGGVSEVTREHVTGVYDLADSFLRNETARHKRVSTSDTPDRVAPTLLQQAVSALRVVEGDAQGLPAFVISKFRNVDQRTAANRASVGALLTMLSRSGLADAEELHSLLP